MFFCKIFMLSHWITESIPCNTSAPWLFLKLTWFILFSELRRTSDWTPWIRTNVTREGFLEQRFRFVCKANVPDMRMLRVSNVKTDYRFCPDSSDHCMDPGELSQKKYSAHNAALRSLCTTYYRKLKKTKNPKNNPKDANEVEKTIPPLLRDSFRYAKTHLQVFRGYCGCRDLGMLRMCRRCRFLPRKYQPFGWSPEEVWCNSSSAYHLFYVGLFMGCSHWYWMYICTYQIWDVMGHVFCVIFVLANVISASRLTYSFVNAW